MRSRLRGMSFNGVHSLPSYSYLRQAMAVFGAPGRHSLHAEALPMLHPRPTPQSTPGHAHLSLLDSYIQRVGSTWATELDAAKSCRLGNLTQQTKMCTHAMQVLHIRGLRDALDLAQSSAVAWSASQKHTFSSIDLLHSCLAKPSEGSVRYQKGEYIQPPKGFLQLKQACLSSYSTSDSTSGNRKSRCLCRKYARYSLPLVDAPSDDAAV